MPLTEKNENLPEPEQKNNTLKRSQQMRQRAMDKDNERTLLGLEQIFETKLAAVKAYEQQLETVQDEFARQTLQQMIVQERRELINLSALTELVEAGPNQSRFNRARLRLNHKVRTNTGKDLAFWLGAAALGAILLPSVRESLRPIAISAVQGVMGLSEQARGLVSGIKEDLEDIVSEAQFEKFKNSLDFVEETDTPPTLDNDPSK